jgi:hypothetical protein
MIRSLIVLVNTLVLFLLGLFSGDNGISVTARIPGKITAGQEVDCELRLNKGSLDGFARLQLEFPEGIIVKDAEEQGASFDFNDGIAKWVWAELPEEEKITISFKLLASVTITGYHNIRGKFSYIENNIKQFAEMPDVGTEVVAPSESPAVATHNLTGRPVASDPDSIASSADPVGDVSLTRSIRPGNSINEFEISIRIFKGATKGFARYSDDLPAGFTAKPVKTDGASFSVADGKVRFVWVSVPTKENLEIIYLISAGKQEELVLRGEYSYLEESQSRKFVLNSETISFQALAPEPEPSPEPPVIVKTHEPAPESPVRSEKKEQKEKTVKSTAPAFTEKKEQGVVYHVQIGAFSKRKVTAAKLQEKFKLSGEIRSEMHGGYTKFMTGTHAEYKDARDHRESIISENGVKSAFVVAYHFGKRITVQEALMISRQKWFK